MVLRAFFLTVLTTLSALLAHPASAQESRLPSTILVLDASGSMWGQIDGVNKIVIAREVITELLYDLPDDLNLGLVAYGHNTRGDCTDIETLMAPATGNRTEIEEIVNALNPRGSTPLSAAVIQAAEALRATEEPATVILVSDGRETCEMDPCEVGRVLEETGIDFTAHVIGFDVADPEERAQLQCLAENTGGQFLTASNAAELTEALEQVTQGPPPPGSVNVRAVLTPGGGTPERPLDWVLLSEAGTEIPGDFTGTSFSTDLAPGAYQVQATRAEPNGPATYASAFLVTSAATTDVIIGMPEIVEPLPVTFTAVVGVDGPVIEEPVIWTVTGADGTLLEETGNPLTSALLPGTYIATAYWTAAETEQSADFVVTETSVEVVVIFEEPLPTAAIVAPETAPAGSPVEVAWDGPNARGEAIEIGLLGEDMDRRWQVAIGSPMTIQMSSYPGTYELRYVMQDRTVIATRTIEVTEVEATLEFAPEVEIGTELEVAWTGPGYDRDHIGIVSPGEDRFVVNRNLLGGSPVTLTAPADPGEYLVVYRLSPDARDLVAMPLTVLPAIASVDVPATAIAGDTIPIAWEGPDARNDYIAVREPGETRDINYAYTRDGSPAQLQMPITPGTYEVAYILSEGRTVLTSAVIEVQPVVATVEAPATALAGATVDVAWTGPDYRNDYIAVREPGETGDINYAYTRDGTPAALLMPTEPGTYEIAYIASQDRTVLASRTIEVQPVEAFLAPPDTAAAGETVAISWRGPDYRNDYIAVREPGETRDINYAYTRDGTPANVLMPTEPGTYEIVYVVSQDRTVLTSVAIEVTDVAAAVAAPDTAIAGETVQVSWRGPDYRNDYIAVREVGSDRDINYAYTRDGTPADLLMPVEPGTYEIAYVVSQDRTVIASTVIEVTPVTAQLTAPATAVAGETVEIAWTGPDYRNDYIAVREVGSDRDINYAYTRDGTPADVLMPVEPGTYEIAYVVSQDRTVIASATITLTPVAATLSGPTQVAPGEAFTIAWTGPDYRNDYIAIRAQGEDRDLTYAYTREGATVELTAPEQPGTYEIAYVVSQDRTVIATLAITVGN